ncbi:MAG: hypothetical protein OEV69_00280 [Gammaproteobacteria bacterium]|nr:hypothetical protein [Gammaproteobacteria bacterium]MDH5320959.1 hypothetical protein [Gammaproteobacteria bacterium]
MKHFPKQICRLPKFDKARHSARFDVATSEIEFWFHTTPAV